MAKYYTSFTYYYYYFPIKKHFVKNCKEVSAQEYSAQLARLGINARAKNFLVFQGTVENIAMKYPREFTALFEEISGSIAVKEEYDRLRGETLRAEEDTVFLVQKKKNVAAERKEARLEKVEADQYQHLRDDLAHHQVLLYLFRLYRCEQDIKDATEAVTKKQLELTGIESRKESLDHGLRDRKKEHSDLAKDLAKYIEITLVYYV